MSDGERSEREWEQMAQWAEHDMRLPTASVTALRGPDAARIGRRLLERSTEKDR
ncbi:hypothetical protein [Prescottella subtropica]|uniref:hypothetical protein n=1 Tax=Prescottella subtropica TaxID=2545757 RepID=UPI001386DB58|nr:hypothetical protein [Prescottella subtropica]